MTLAGSLLMVLVLVAANNAQTVKLHQLLEQLLSVIYAMLITTVHQEKVLVFAALVDMVHLVSRVKHHVND